MQVRQRIENKVLITLTGDVDLTTAKKIVVYIKQGNYFLEKTPDVVDAKSAYVTITYGEAMRLRDEAPVRMQTAWSDANGNDIATDPVNVTVGELLKAEGYDGN